MSDPKSNKNRLTELSDRISKATDGVKELKAKLFRAETALEMFLKTQKKYYGNATETHLAMIDVAVVCKDALRRNNDD